MQTRILPNRRATRILGKELAQSLGPGALVLLSGDLGAGKTFLARAILRALGVEEGTVVPSPTFTLLQEYETSHGLVIHADLYRLRDLNPEVELPKLGLIERRREGAMLLVEWGEGYEAFLGKHTVSVHLSAPSSTLGTKREARIGLENDAC
jgi:tRNA threonylcarbamoyladenosine biosynthesis protein TsaE